MSKVVELNHPIKAVVDGKEEVISKVQMKRRCKVRDQIQGAELAGNNRAGIEAYIMSACFNIPFDAVCEMDLGDYEKISEAYSDFMDGPQIST